MWWFLAIWILLGVLAHATVNGVRSYQPAESESDEIVIRVFKLVGYIVPPGLLLFILIYEGVKPYKWIYKQITDRIYWEV